jgi:hypothetical protein
MEITNISLRGIINWIEALFNNQISELYNTNRIVKTVRSSKDENGIFTRVEWFDANNILVRESGLSDGTSPTYTYRIQNDYDVDSNLISIKYFRQRYDDDNVWISEEPINEIE